MATYQSMVHTVFVLTLFVGPGTAQGFVRTDQRFDESLIGEWSVESSNLAGKQSKANPPTARVRITMDQVQLINEGKTELELDCSLDRLKTPHEIDLTFDLDKGNGPIKMSVKGIFKADGGKIILCFNGDPNGERPKKFKKATKANGFMVFTLTKARQSIQQER